MAGKKASEDLFKLIHSLTVEEKGYFKKFARRHTSGGNIYLSVFDAINKQKEFDEKALSKKYKNYAVIKVYLLDLVLQSLMMFQKDINSQRTLLNELIYIDILKNKGLRERASARQEKALKVAEEEENFWMEDRLLKDSFEYNWNRWKPQELMNSSNEFYERLKLLHRKRWIKDECWNAVQTLYNLEINRYHRLLPDANPDKFVDYDFLADSSNDLSVSNRRYRLTALIKYHFLKGDFQNCYLSLQEQYAAEKKLWDEDAPLKRFDAYTGTVCGLIYTCWELKKFEDANELNEKLLEIYKLKPQEKIRGLYSYGHHKLAYYWETGRHTEGEAFLNHFMEKLEVEKNKKEFIGILIELYKGKVLFEFCNKNYKKIFISLAEFENFLNDEPKGYLRDCQLMKILLQIDIGNFKGLPKMIANYARDWQDSLLAVEKDMMARLTKVNERNKIEILNEIKEVLQVEDKPIKIFRTMYLMHWIYSQLTGEKIGNIIKRGNGLVLNPVISERSLQSVPS